LPDSYLYTCVALLQAITFCCSLLKIHHIFLELRQPVGSFDRPRLLYLHLPSSNVITISRIAATKFSDSAHQQRRFPESVAKIATTASPTNDPAAAMTQDENSSEVFLGPTGSETEEFYSFQRTNPGLEKAEYLEWFQKRFNKEIELRRRRSDQPSDLEFMVIKKRSKYRERIGEESAELCRHSEQYPQKTYRELAEWFQERFGKEIDITAISSKSYKNSFAVLDWDSLL
jgi:hypothetical protein